MKEVCSRPLGALTALVALMLLSITVAACVGGGEDLSAWDHDPIVPGYSAADVNIGDPFSAVQEVHGEPDENLEDGGYHYAYYGRTSEGGRINDPASWRLVITLYDDGNGYLDAADEVGAIEVSSPYHGLTAGGVGMGSPIGDVEAEFGTCENVTDTRSPEGKRIMVYSYSQRGVEFLISPPDGVITVLITAYGGMQPVEEEGGNSGEAQGGLFGTYSSQPIIPGQTAAGINVGDEFQSVEEKYGGPDNTGFTTEGLVYATYTGGYGTWKLNVYMEDMDQNEDLGDFDEVVSISVRHPYEGRTPQGVGIGSPSSDVLTEFGSPERQSIVMHQGEELTIMEYNSRGIVFAVNSNSGQVVEIDVNRPLTN